ncbi:unnamed protein product [Protopolystoma xenopodis]|uniref:Uncharacterized protein n=1 Tax=Protopolystoma xenopodis TaxID=117903 RepID=A0A448XPI5_9PLAT|nr:unnamed protein product [Protopolystoma xenopodis]
MRDASPLQECRFSCQFRTSRPHHHTLGVLKRIRGQPGGTALKNHIRPLSFIGTLPTIALDTPFSTTAQTRLPPSGGQASERDRDSAPTRLCSPKTHLPIIIQLAWQPACLGRRDS